MASEIISEKPGINRAACLLMLQALAFWPVLAWYFQRLVDPSDEPWGLLALATVLVYIYARRRSLSSIQILQNLQVLQVLQISPTSLRAALSLIVVYTLLLPHAPVLVCAMVAVASLACTASDILIKKPFHAGIWGLCLLSLPLIASLQFYLGYPLRLLVAHLAAPMLQATGYAVSLSGTAITWRQFEVGIDPACSGIRMLWTALYLAMALACFKDLNGKKTLIMASIAVTAAIVANVFRATSLFYLEVIPHLVKTPVPMPVWMHEGTGVALFAIVAAVISLIASRLAAHNPAGTNVPVGVTPGRRAASLHSPLKGVARITNRLLLFAITAMVAAVVPFTYQAARETVSTETISDWPSSFEGQPLQPVNLTADELRFSSGFPGKIAKFTDGGKQIVMRWIARETRQLHPSEDCFRGLGYRIHPLPRRKIDGHYWGCFAADRGDVHLVVREMVSDRSGQTWTDVSQWYWSALFHRTQAPWLATTVAETLEGGG